MKKSDIEKLNILEIKNLLIQEGVTLDKKEHPKDYYIKLYLENSKKLNILT